jgi:hypothetical protein
MAQPPETGMETMCGPGGPTIDILCADMNNSHSSTATTTNTVNI